MNGNYNNTAIYVVNVNEEGIPLLYKILFKMLVKYNREQAFSIVVISGTAEYKKDCYCGTTACI